MVKDKVELLKLKKLKCINMPRGTCWRGYEQKGFKKKGSKSVPNCVAIDKKKKKK